MLVCDCMGVEYDEIKEAYLKHGNDIDVISEETGAGTGCGCCMHDDCDKVDLPLPLAIKKAAEEAES